MNTTIKTNYSILNIVGICSTLVDLAQSLEIFLVKGLEHCLNIGIEHNEFETFIEIYII